MNKNIIKIGLGLFLGMGLTLTSCNKEPNESNLYTFTGQTIQDFLVENNEQLSSFNYIMNRSGYDRMMASYGQYTCYAPVNEGVESYLDSLYNDPEARISHNGMTEVANYATADIDTKLAALSDSLCSEIAQYHLSARINTFLDDLQNGTGSNIATVLGTPFISKLCDDGEVRFNDASRLMSFDNEMTNGYVHIIDRVIPRSTRYIADVLNLHNEFSIFADALRLTGLADSLEIEDRGITYTMKENIGRPGMSWANTKYYYPTTCKEHFTIFAETNEVFAAYGIYKFDDLVGKCKEWYENSKEWYDYLREHEGELYDNGKDVVQISTGDDYTNRFNVVNMFVAYHILRAGMSYSKLVYVRDSKNVDWNFAFGGEPHDYYETMLPHTLMKIWQPLYHNSNDPAGNTIFSENIWINRYKANNTLTDEVGTQGSDAMHPLQYKGCLVMPAYSDIQSYNGYIHGINDVLLYNELVPRGVLNERLRMDATAFVPELINNNIRFTPMGDITALNLMQNASNAGDRVRIPNNFCKGIKSYNDDGALCYLVKGAWRSWEADQLGGWNAYDYAFRLPPVPTGTYEIRIIYPPMANSGFMQFYLGTSSNVGSMQPLGIPVDARYPDTGKQEDRISTGYLLSQEFDDYGVASDLAMRNHSYMRAPASFSRGTYNTVKTPATSAQDLISNISGSCRYEEGYGTSMIRKILGTKELQQGKEYWLRMKNLLPDYPQYGFSFDFIELVPTNIVNSQDYTEDWY